MLRNSYGSSVVSLEQSQRLILETINAHDGEWNWYKVSRRCIGLLSSPSELKLSPLLDSGLIEEQVIADEPLPRLFVTKAGKAALSEESS